MNSEKPSQLPEPKYRLIMTAATVCLGIFLIFREAREGYFWLPVAYGVMVIVIVGINIVYFMRRLKARRDSYPAGEADVTVN